MYRKSYPSKISLPKPTPSRAWWTVYRAPGGPFIARVVDRSSGPFITCMVDHSWCAGWAGYVLDGSVLPVGWVHQIVRSGSFNTWIANEMVFVSRVWRISCVCDGSYLRVLRTIQCVSGRLVIACSTDESWRSLGPFVVFDVPFIACLMGVRLRV